MQQGSYMLIEPGMQVHGTDGTLGTVAEVVADTGVDVFRGIVLSHGLLMPKKTLIVPEAIVSVTDQGVQVNLSKEQAEQLPAVTSGVTPREWGTKMKLSTTLTAMGLLGVMAAAALTPQAAFASESNSQKNKNNWRNGAIAGGAVALYGLTKHNKTATIVGVAGAAYSAKRYEDDRRHQAQRRAARARYHRLHHRVIRHK